MSLTSGDVVEMATGITVLVGPNNAGKSLILRDIRDYVANGPQAHSPFKAVGKVKLAYSGTSMEFFDRLKRFHGIREPGVYPQGTFHEPHVIIEGQVVTVGLIGNFWNIERPVGPFAAQVLRLLDATGRLSVPLAGVRWNPYREVPSTPVQRLFASRDLEAKISSYMMRAFGMPLTVHRYNGNEIILHVGVVEAIETVEPASLGYLNEIWSLPLWADQGDGVRAFLGVLLTLMTADYPIVMVDEPEAFLHPPQAQLLGRLLVEILENGTQVIVATHSADIIDGITAAAASASNVSIARVTRSKDGNKVAQVSPMKLRKLYDDPLIKYYNVLDGLFSSGVVLCEADSDCTYYRAVLDTLGTLESGTPAQSVSTHFTHCGGKDRLPKAVGALRSANVPVACIVDIDFLQNDRDFEALVLAYDGDPSEYRSWRNVVTSAINQKTQKPMRAAVQAEMQVLFADARSGPLTSGERTKISNVISGTSGWKEFKKSGRSCLSGEAVSAFDRLTSALRTLGIFVVELGELERFHPEIRSENKAFWLRNVIECGLYRDSSEAKKLVSAIIESIAGAQ